MNLKPYLYSSLALAALFASTPGAQAQDQWVITKAGPADANGMTPKFAVIKRNQPLSATRRALTLAPTWVYTLTHSGKKFSETFIGTNPTGGASTTVPVYIVPIKLVTSTGVSSDPTTVTQNGVSIIQNILNSPIFSSTIDYKQGATDLGTTQYEDAFQRATLWGTVSAHTGYHVLLSTVVEPVQTITLPKADGAVATAFGASEILFNANYTDAKIQAMITSLKIPSNALPFFVVTGAYMTSGAPTTANCCIGGYHSVSTAGQPYGITTYITTSGAFSQNISAMSHELGEWIDDPNTNNPVPAKCGSGAVLEVGDPLEGDANYGDHAYTVGGVTWDPQDLVLLPYFGAVKTTSVNGWSTFQGKTIAFCSKGG
jgi:hypothetical protein